MSDEIQKLVEEFSRFPGVGPRQAKRFAYYLLTRDEAKLGAFARLLAGARKAVSNCPSCMRLFARSGTEKLCDICSDEGRDRRALMVVAHDVDVESVEKSGVYKGDYFVLGGTIPILDENPETHVRLAALKKSVAARTGKGLSEIILALDLNPEGEHTTEYLMNFLSPLVKEKTVKITVLGRGLSTGTELQYSDPDTLKNALQNRSQQS